MHRAGCLPPEPALGKPPCLSLRGRQTEHAKFHAAVRAGRCADHAANLHGSQPAATEPPLAKNNELAENAPCPAGRRGGCCCHGKAPLILGLVGLQSADACPAVGAGWAFPVFTDKPVARGYFPAGLSLFQNRQKIVNSACLPPWS